MRRLLGNRFWRVLLRVPMFLALPIITIRPAAINFDAKCTQVMAVSYCQCPLGKTQVHCLCVTFQINMINLVPEATKQLPTQVNVTTINTNHHKKNLKPTIWKPQHPLPHCRFTSHGDDNSCSLRECTVFLRSPTVSDFNSQGYLPSVFVDGAAMGRVDAIAIPMDPLNQSMVTGPSDWVQPRREAGLRKRVRGFSQDKNTAVHS